MSKPSCSFSGGCGRDAGHHGRHVYAPGAGIREYVWEDAATHAGWLLSLVWSNSLWAVARK